MDPFNKKDDISGLGTMSPGSMGSDDPTSDTSVGVNPATGSASGDMSAGSVSTPSSPVAGVGSSTPRPVGSTVDEPVVPSPVSDMPAAPAEPEPPTASDSTVGYEGSATTPATSVPETSGQVGDLGGSTPPRANEVSPVTGDEEKQGGSPASGGLGGAL